MPGKTVDQWIDAYGESHRDETNKLIHWACVPLIAASLLALMWDLPVPSFMHRVPYLNWATLFILCALIFYLRLSFSMAVGMFLFAAMVISVVVIYERAGIGPVWKAALLVFALSWVAQFVGHKIEGKKPSFLQDLQFLLIGPLWILAVVYRKLGIHY